MNKLSPTRKRYYTLLRVAKQGLQMDDDSYRALLTRHGATIKDGKISASTMHIVGLMGAYGELKAKGFKPTHKSRASKVVTGNRNQKMYGKIIFLWCTGADAGVINSRGEEAMIKWCMRHVEEDAFEWGSVKGLSKCIEGLKAWLQREHVKY